MTHCGVVMVRTALALAVCLGSAPASRGQTLGTEFTFQGELRSGGTPASGLFDLRFRLYDNVAAGLPLGGVLCADNVVVTSGRFSVVLDFGAQFSGESRYLEIDVRPDAGLACEDPEGFITLGSRLALTGTPNALFALTSSDSARLNGQAAGFYQDASSLTSGVIPDRRISGPYTGAVSFTNAGNSFFGTFNGSGMALTGVDAARLGGFSASSYLRSIPVPLNVEGSSPEPIVFGVNSSSANAAVAVRGDCSFAGNGFTIGVRGSIFSQRGYGVYGGALHTTGANYGGYFESVSMAGTGLAGHNSSLDGNTTGVLGRVDSPRGRAIYAFAPANGDVSYGVYSDVRSELGISIYGGAPYYGLFGACNVNSTSARGIIGSAPGNFAIAVFSAGRFVASGTKSFQIDHPEAPQSKYLRHYSAESPEPLNVYSGIVILDETGGAGVELPTYFAMINRDARYLLTALGSPMPMLHVAEEIDADALRLGESAGPGGHVPACTFRIAGGTPGGRVSWEVKAVRNDLWVRTHGAPVEIEKDQRARGRYQHPELYGMPPELSEMPRAEPSDLTPSF